MNFSGPRVTPRPSLDVAGALRQSCTHHFQESLRFLKKMVEINSFTLNTKGVSEVGRLVVETFEPLGFEPEWVGSSNPEFARHLVLERKGSGPTIALISHLDTVFTTEEERCNNFAWRVEGNRIYGPGTIDVKGGTAMAHLFLCALKETMPELFEKVRWVFLLNSSEEMPSADFGVLCKQRVPSNALAALVMEGGACAGDAHALVAARKGRALFRVEARGRSAHAGNLHQRGVNAITQLAHTVQRIEALTNHGADLTFNVGVVSGGSVVNRIPHHASAEVEMRAFEPAVFEAGLNAFHALKDDIVVRSIEDECPCRVSIEPLTRIQPWPPNEATEELVKIWREAGRLLGMQIVTQQRGGLSDGNYLCSHVPTLDGLGPCGDHAHCSERSADGSKDQEYMEIESYVPRAVLNALAIQMLIVGTGN